MRSGVADGGQPDPDFRKDNSTLWQAPWSATVKMEVCPGAAWVLQTGPESGRAPGGVASAVGGPPISVARAAPLETPTPEPRFNAYGHAQHRDDEESGHNHCDDYFKCRAHTDPLQ